MIERAWMLSVILGGQLWTPLHPIYNADVHWCSPFSTSYQYVTRKSAIHRSSHYPGRLENTNTSLGHRSRRIKIVQHEQVFEPYRMLFKEMKRRKKQ